MKEAAGAVTGDEDKKAEGQAQQRKGAAGEEATQKSKRRQTEKEAREAERERDKQRRKDKGGLLGNVGDTLSGRQRDQPYSTVGRSPSGVSGSGLCLPSRSLNFGELRLAELR